MKTLTLVALGLIMTTNSLLACMMAPRPIVWYTPKDKAYHYSVKKDGLVSIVDAKDHKKVLWKTQLKNFSQWYDRIHVVDDGNRIVNVRGNHSVHKLTDVAVEENETFILKAYNCPYHELAQEHRDICEMDEKLMQQVLGSDVSLSQCMMDGHSGCSFVVSRTENNK